MLSEPKTTRNGISVINTMQGQNSVQEMLLPEVWKKTHAVGRIKHQVSQALFAREVLLVLFFQEKNRRNEERN